MGESEEHKTGDPEFKYWAFISYSHDDETWAKWLHESLETYSVPGALVGRNTGKHGKLPKRVFPVFRDRDELPGAADLGGKIKNALSQSRNLIVVCSTTSATSKWVNEEIKTYKAMGRDDRVLCLIIDGEPNASDDPESELQECFPPALRFRVEPNGELSEERAEPIAADVREGKDGRRNAKLKLLSGLLDVGYDELRQRDKRRRTRRRVINISGVLLLTLLLIAGYLALADLGVSMPGRDSIQTLLDRRDVSVMRRAPSLEEIRAQATPIRRTLIDALHNGRTPDGWIKTNLNPAEDQWIEVWSHSQSLCGIFKSLEVSNDEARKFLPGLDLPFTPGVAVEKDGVKFGWQSHKGEAETIAEPALWTAAALAAALGRPDFLTAEERRKYEGHLAYTQEVLRLYRPLQTGGWNMFPQQKEPELHNPYTTALALLALLETRKAGLPWDGSSERRDELLNDTARWLISKFDYKARMEGKRPGWHGVSESANQIFDGLTLQIYAELLRAETEAGIELPPEILEQIPVHLISCVERDLNFPVASGEFSARMTDHTGREAVGKETIGFLWYPWAIDAGMRWLARADK
ncbi:MAG TPA: toll/interleukin-1 receptor domain-containing protein, partial [Pyrinomonadaceae bacterium]|nr:toll/interleukin-1 receptor domain-containing protein [Pyrinomonadaceae bacterium]